MKSHFIWLFLADNSTISYCRLMLFHGLAIYIHLGKANGTTLTYGSILGQEGIWRLMLFPYQWFLVTLSFGTLHIFVSHFVNFPKTTTPFFYTNQNFQKKTRRAITLIWRKVLHCEHLHPWWRAWLYFIHCRTAGHFFLQRNEQEYEHAKLKISMPETRKTPQVVCFDFRHETKPTRISFKTPTLGFRYPRFQQCWLAEDVFFEAGPTVSGGLRQLSGDFPDLKFLWFCRFPQNGRYKKPKNALL